MSVDYKDAGVNIEKGYEAVQRIKKDVESTHGPEVVGGIGGFGGMFAPDVSGMTQPILVSGTDGVGTKLKLAFALDKHDSIGIDCVAMCVNDIICVGAKPLFFLDYIATGKLEPQQVEGIVAGIAEGCRQSGAALVGGETAEMPGFYARGEYDVAGFTVGMVDQPKMIDGKAVEQGDVIIGLSSSGVHSNGFSLVRKLFPEDRWNESFDESTLGETLLTPTKIYVKSVLSVMENHSIHAIAHITGGGFIENIPRAYPDQFQAAIKKGAWSSHNIFKLIQETSLLDDDAMYNTFNMGIGMVLIVSAEDVDPILTQLREMGEQASPIGYIKNRDSGESPICFE
ncbi:MAG: phosphoribosylformylglycinamidine cyclo-ligase [Candidatus Marinimicrobia bacterium]|jgi:phosphoribosylformylglycinamidine cyclo-ligase|nr:phosphoribosylformylglycinamidine cyclo-ligase [Candidatus Neomarinimicrobiota bacterium]MBT4359628.1 phosphoribosylformylglycinamidine cyclo-ligase [Candidatus Neomarinimicrobiota bacterium]MBT4713607.1 phosphoribosylformylglycinamidine cyclo-ligase [Candidatus Neomarinimicrobiota bacterium]MBT4947094.1 phosphoribosylformylglycinamidine cyclo-ligase [Candidatus Neomarinimicrobiota bacterium]MBT5268114.1 phosphoribosylformylglycinamidine cyclo-ligase [Candidatus Neomarinimicrobiota bacterium